MLPEVLTRRLAVGLVVLAYDHTLTLGDEITLVWTAPHSFAKWAFLVNRYFVLCMLIIVAYGVSPSYIDSARY